MVASSSDAVELMCVPFDFTETYHQLGKEYDRVRECANAFPRCEQSAHRYVGSAHRRWQSW
jgi:hypothetical protein